MSYKVECHLLGSVCSLFLSSVLVLDVSWVFGGVSLRFGPLRAQTVCWLVGSKCVYAKLSRINIRQLQTVLNVKRDQYKQLFNQPKPSQPSRDASDRASDNPWKAMQLPSFSKVGQIKVFSYPPKWFPTLTWHKMRWVEHFFRWKNPPGGAPAVSTPSPVGKAIGQGMPRPVCIFNLRALWTLQEPFWGIEWDPTLQQMNSMIRQCADGFGNSILMDFALLKTRIRAPVPDLCHFEISRIWERNTESVREKYISTGRWQIQSQVVRNTIRRTNARVLVWTEIHMQPQIAVLMQAQIYE